MKYLIPLISLMVLSGVAMATFMPMRARNALAIVLGVLIVYMNLKILVLN